MTRKLDGQCVLFVYGEMDLFVVQLQEALDGEGAESVIARTPADALIQLKRFDFDAALINYTGHTDDGDPLFRRMVTTHSDRWRPGWRESAVG